MCPIHNTYLFIFISYLNCTKREKDCFCIINLPFSNSGIRAQVEQPYSCVIKMEDVITYDGDMNKLIVHNYFYWKTMMEDHLIYRDFAEPILNKNIPEGKNEN